MPDPISVDPPILEIRDETVALQAEAYPNNQYLVYDRLTGNWVGTWEGDALRAALLVEFHQGEALRGAVVNPDGTVRQLLQEPMGNDDGVHEGAVFEAEVDVGDQEGRTLALNVELEHHYGAWATFVEAQGNNEKLGPLQMAPDAAVCDGFDDPEYDLSNVNDDQLKEKRQDYATLWDETGVYISQSKGLMFGQRQTRVQKVRFGKRHRSVRVRIETMRGWVGIRKLAQRLKPVAFGRGRKG